MDGPDNKILIRNLDTWKSISPSFYEQLLRSKIYANLSGEREAQNLGVASSSVH